MAHPASTRRRISWWAWPVVLAWRLVTSIANMIGIVAALTLGVVFMLVGALLIQTVVGFFLGAPLFIIGLLLFVRGLY
jgi:hypothetical protein